MREAGPTLPVAGSWTIGSLSDHLAELDLFPAGARARALARVPALGLRVRGARPGTAPGRPRAAGAARARAPAAQLRRVDAPGTASDGEGEPCPRPPSSMMDVLERYPGTRFKLDPTNTWSDELIAELAATGAVDSLDLKGQYKGTPGGRGHRPRALRQAHRGLPGRLARGPRHNRRDAPAARAATATASPGTRRSTRSTTSSRSNGSRARSTSSRRGSGSLVELCRAYDFCAERGIGAYGGGQTELGVGRDHIQYLAALFHPDTPNDVAPGGFNQPKLPEGLPAEPAAA